MDVDRNGTVASFTTGLDAKIMIRPADGASTEWQEFERGPGRFIIPYGFEACVRVKNLDDEAVLGLVDEIAACPALICLDLAENRKVTDASLKRIARLTQLKVLNLSSCDITDRGLVWLKDLKNLRVLNLSYCNRLSDAGLKHLRALSSLIHLDLQGCPRIKHAAIVKTVARRGLTVHA